MNFFRRRQDERRKKPRPDGRLASFFHGCVSIFFYCVLGDAAAVSNDGTSEIVNEPSSSTSMVVQGSNSSMNIIKHSQIYHRRTNHDPIISNCLTNGPSYQVAHSTSIVGTFGEGKENEPSKNRKKWFSWLKSGSKKNKVVEAFDKNDDHNGSAKTAHGIQQHQQASSSESSFQILQLTASPGGARKGYRSFHAELFDVAGPKGTSCLQEQSDPSFADTMRDIDLDNVASRENLDKRSLDDTDKRHDRLQTFSLSDISSFGESEMSDSSSSFTEVTSLSSGQLSDCWGVLSESRQLPPSLSSSSSTDVLTTDQEISDEEQTFSLSDVSSFGESEILDSSSSFTQVTSLSSGQLSDCWGMLSEGCQLPPSLSQSSSTDALKTDEEISDKERVEVCEASAVELPAAPERTISTGTHGIMTSDSTEMHTSTDSSGSTDISADNDSSESTPIQVCSDAPSSAAIPLDTVHVSSESDSIQACSDAVCSPDTPTVHVDASHVALTVGEVAGGTITDVYALIVRTLNMDMHKSSVKHQALATNTSTSHQDISVSNESPKACLDTTERPCLDAEDAKSDVPEHSTPSLHKIHTEWLPKEHVNIEVFLGLKEHKTSVERLSVQRFMEEGEKDSTKPRIPSTLSDSAILSRTEKDHLAAVASEMSLDFGVASRRDFASSH